MALLLKIGSRSFRSAETTVSALKSVRLEPGDVGSEVYVWFTDGTGSKSALGMLCRLDGFEATQMQQRRDPTKSKPGYLLSLTELARQPRESLTTDDLGEFRYVQDDAEVGNLGRLHRDRNEKIIRLSDREGAFLAHRFDRPLEH